MVFVPQETGEIYKTALLEQVIKLASDGISVWAVSYTHLDVYKRQAYNAVQEKYRRILFKSMRKKEKVK